MQPVTSKTMQSASNERLYTHEEVVFAISSAEFAEFSMA